MYLYTNAYHIHKRLLFLWWRSLYLKKLSLLKQSKSYAMTHDIKTCTEIVIINLFYLYSFLAILPLLHLLYWIESQNDLQISVI